MKNHYNVGVLGATGIVGKTFLKLLTSHPYFHVNAVAASARSAGKKLGEVSNDVPFLYRDMRVLDVNADFEEIVSKSDFVFCALKGEESEIKELETKYAKAEIPVISCNSANRFSEDVPMVIPELNPSHLKVIESQKNRLHTLHGFIAVKSNCILQSFLPLVYPLLPFGISEIQVVTMQAVSGAGKTLSSFPSVQGNILPFISGEEEKCEREPLKILGTVKDGKIRLAERPVISASCFRVPVENGHTASITVRFLRQPKREEILDAWKTFCPLPQKLKLPSAPIPFLRYFEDTIHPQPNDLLSDSGMSIYVGRLRPAYENGYSFVGVSDNLIRGAAGGAILLAELLREENYL